MPLAIWLSALPSPKKEDQANIKNFETYKLIK